MANKIRPRFTFYTVKQKSDILDLFKSKAHDTIRSNVYQNKITLSHKSELQHYWSPELTLSLYDEEDQTQINGLIGPQQNVWAMFLFMYAISGLLGFFIGIYGLILWSLGDFTTWLLAIPLSIIILILIYIAAKFGQKKGHDEMVELIDYFKTVIGESHLFKNKVEH